jgi:hypothetical protein
MHKKYCTYHLTLQTIYDKKELFRVYGALSKRYTLLKTSKSAVFSYKTALLLAVSHFFFPLYGFMEGDATSQFRVDFPLFNIFYHFVKGKWQFSRFADGGHTSPSRPTASAPAVLSTVFARQGALSTLDTSM